MEGDSSREGAERDALYKVAYDEAARALSEQLTAIDNLRGRAGFLLSAAAIATSVLSGQALTNGSSSAFLWLALASFIAVAAASVAILWPRLAEFTADPSEIILSYIEAENPAPIQKLHRDLSLHMHRSYVGNLTALTRLADALPDCKRLVDRRDGFLGHRHRVVDLESIPMTRKERREKLRAWESRPQLQPERPSPMQPETLGFSLRYLLPERFWPVRPPSAPPVHRDESEERKEADS